MKNNDWKRIELIAQVSGFLASNGKSPYRFNFKEMSMEQLWKMHSDELEESIKRYYEKYLPANKK